MDTIPPEALLELYPDAMREIAGSLRAIVRRAAPEAIEGVRLGWRLIGYDFPLSRSRSVFFCYVAPEAEHVHLGFRYGVLMADRERLLAGAGVTRRARWVTIRAGDAIESERLEELVREAARVAVLPQPGRLAALVRSEGSPD